MATQTRTLSRILLLGAGFSQPAGIPTITKMTEDFFQNPAKALKENEKNTVSEFLISFGADRIKILDDVTRSNFHQSDLEYMLTLLRELEDEQDFKYFESRYPALIQLFGASEIPFQGKLGLIKWYRTILQNYVRNACENISSIQYLYGLDGLIQTEPLSVFTLNYDGIIENFCEQQHIKYQDGFNPQWTPEVFQEKNTKINLFKLHGSLYWVRSKNGKVVRIPIQGIDMSSMRYIDGSPISEMMLYPEIQKDKELEVYTWLNRRFKDELNRSDLCIIIGYSFRDRDVKNSILESLNSNPNLWLIIVNPHASKIKHDLVSDNELISTRIIAMDMGVEDALAGRKLHSRLDILDIARNTEEQAWAFQKINENRLDYLWRHCLNNYSRIDQHDRVKWIVEKLDEIQFSGISGNFPEIIEADLCPLSIRFMIEYYLSNNQKKFSVWGKIFLDSCTYLEYVFFNQRRGLQEHNPVNVDDIPSRVISYSAIPEGNLLQLKDEATKISTKIPNEKFRKAVSKLIETLDLLSYKEYLNKERTSFHVITDEKILEGYSQKDLGMRKWATEIVRSLKS
ncbi:MAG: SIR2 family protein [Nitrosotalea sp.]